MTRFLRRWFRCRQHAHRDALRMVPCRLHDAPPSLIAHSLWWVCVDCGTTRHAGWSDNIEDERKAGRIA